MADISPEDMFKRLSSQGHIRQIMEENTNHETKVVEMTQKDLIKALYTGVELCINLMIHKGVATVDEVAEFGAFMSQIVNQIFDDEEGDE